MESELRRILDQHMKAGSLFQAFENANFFPGRRNKLPSRVFFQMKGQLLNSRGSVSSRSLHDGRLPTLEDTVEFFNLVMQLNLNAQEKKDLIAS